MTTNNEDEAVPKIRVLTYHPIPKIVGTDSAVSGPSPDNMFHISVLRDIVEFNSQTLNPVEETEAGLAHRLSFGAGDTTLARELVGQMILSDSAFTGLLSSMATRLVESGRVSEVEELLAGIIEAARVDD